jgi:hypothetical protein
MFINVIRTAKIIIQAVDNWDDSVIPLLEKAAENENSPAVFKQAVAVIKKWEPAIIENGKKVVDFVDSILGAEESGKKGADKLEVATKEALDANVPEELKKFVDLGMAEVNKTSPEYLSTMTKIDSLVSSANSIVKAVPVKENSILDTVQEVTEKASDVMSFINSFLKKV